MMKRYIGKVYMKMFGLKKRYFVRDLRTDFEVEVATERDMEKLMDYLNYIDEEKVE